MELVPLRSLGDTLIQGLPDTELREIYAQFLGNRPIDWSALLARWDQFRLAFEDVSACDTKLEALRAGEQFLQVLATEHDELRAAIGRELTRFAQSSPGEKSHTVALHASRSRRLFSALDELDNFLRE
jgi:hypothetical protein